jgi:hypothetical protein
MFIPGLSDEFSDNFSDDLGLISMVFLGYIARFLGYIDHRTDWERRMFGDNLYGNFFPNE